MTGRISAFQSLGTVDGPGVRAVVFASGCPLRCGYCHNPETWSERGTEVSEDELLAKILRLKPYIRHGGVTFSGGEPLLQAEFFASLARSLKAEGLHVALDTSGNGGDAHVGELLDAVDLVLLDVKFSDEKDYRAYTGGSFARTMDFLADVRSRGKRVWIRRVIVAGLKRKCARSKTCSRPSLTSSTAWSSCLSANSAWKSTSASACRSPSAHTTKRPPP